MSLFERVKETAKKRSMTLLVLSAKAGLGEKTIYKWKTQVPKTETLQKVADVLGVSVDFLLGNTDDPTSTETKQKQKNTDLASEGVFFYDGREISEDTMNFIRETLKRIQK
ncbi:helix-turn-helix domain-containing protein [Periweissella ghanensis]|uniref:HTH cro/C1-type domain-containing protein n=1 Tax=Periweissella ghanensis TaxID=467997 RepID=A0ABM8ZD60_9LACO|nr:helix-turn-helix domain-containing protein [Periweissella ghanensis]MCM0600329.1 helix-turn-helix transcriptional regulator [Periweissella ghanensis]CAH0419241.1 hypothetical protein WGH24286_01688 [Periweissella ghanensis]